MRIRDRKNSDPGWKILGSGINNRDRQHCVPTMRAYCNAYDETLPFQVGISWWMPHSRWPYSGGGSTVLNRNTVSTKHSHGTNLSRWGFLDESPVVGGDITVVWVLLQHVDLQLDLLLLILCHVHHWNTNRRSIAMQILMANHAVFRIRRIRTFLGLLDPNPDPSIIKQNSKKNLNFYCFVTSLWLFIFEKLYKCSFKKL